MITIIAGTNRPGSNTLKVTRQVESIYASLRVPHRVLDLAKLPAEIFSPTSYAQKPASFQPFLDSVLTSSGLVVVSPEYNGGIPGILKYFIDMLKFPESFIDRPVCFVGLAAGVWGALRPIEQLQQIFGYRNAFVYPQRVFMPGVGDLIGDDDRIKDSEIIERLKAQADGFVGFVEKLKGVRLRPDA
jgi:NAD(P)H-dependent FMN reductase